MATDGAASTAGGGNHSTSSNDSSSTPSTTEAMLTTHGQMCLSKQLDESRAASCDPFVTACAFAHDECCLCYFLLAICLFVAIVVAEMIWRIYSCNTVKTLQCSLPPSRLLSCLPWLASNLHNDEHFKMVSTSTPRSRISISKRDFAAFQCTPTRKQMSFAIILQNHTLL